MRGLSPWSSAAGFRGETPGCQSCHGKEVLDGRCLLSLGPQSHSAAQQRTGSRISRGCDEESSEEDRPFLPRLLQEIIFAHNPYEGVFHNRPNLQENLLCRSDWLRLRGTSETECMILPVRELAAFPRCSVREQLKAEERSPGAMVPVAPTPLDDSRQQSNSIPWAEQTAIALGAQTVSTTHLQISGNFTWTWMETCAPAD